MPKLKSKDPLTADNITTSEGALKLLRLLPDDYDSMTKEEKQKARESRLRYLPRIEKNFGLMRLRLKGNKFSYLKSQCERILAEAVEDGKNLLAF